MIKKNRQVPLILVLLLSLPACSSLSFNNPFGSGQKAQAGVPQNATEYICEGDKRFYVRILNQGADAWLIYPQHEVNLAKVNATGSRYASGAITLELDNDNASLNDGEKIAYTSCKPQLTTVKK
ncbi:MAG: hypothetical protein CVU29_05480 [Betaproteobacteria bacterium HGW-Betaproteobacteria-22]|nr:MAG: hypothetical protein CVU29_05480 [Betaproteobacteria bacterium HGW-Betaproteobacteria-22]